MAITINRLTNVIFVPQADLTFIAGSLYELDVDVFRRALKVIEASEEGIVFTDTHQHNTEVVLSGVTYARTITILPPYTVEFEDLQYTVRAVGANHNIADVKVLNQVSLIIGNSGGLISSGVINLIEKFLRNKSITDPVTGIMTIYDDDSTTPLFTAPLKEDAAGAQPYRGQGAERRERFT